MGKIFDVLGICAVLGFSAAQAGQSVGNGGDALVCPSGVTFYDWYESSALYGLVPKHGPGSATAVERAQKVVGRLIALNPTRALRYAHMIDHFMSEAQFVSGASLIDLPDVGLGAIPANCHLAQLAVQRSYASMPGERRYLIDAELWNRLELDQQAALIVHEVILRELMETAEGPLTNTVAVRHFNALLLADAMAEFDEPRWYKTLHNWGFDSADADGSTVRLSVNGVPTFDFLKSPDARPDRLDLRFPESRLQFDHEVRLRDVLVAAGHNPESCEAGLTVHFTHGRLVGFSSDPNASGCAPILIETAGGSFPVTEVQATVDAQGVLRKQRLRGWVNSGNGARWASSTLDLNFFAPSSAFGSTFELELWPNGELRRFVHLPSMDCAKSQSRARIHGSWHRVSSDASLGVSGFSVAQLSEAGEWLDPELLCD